MTKSPIPVKNKEGEERVISGAEEVFSLKIPKARPRRQKVQARGRNSTESKVGATQDDKKSNPGREQGDERVTSGAEEILSLLSGWP
jgi:hypothetical protein